jgi:biopolymer transport protein ExbB
MAQTEPIIIPFEANIQDVINDAKKIEASMNALNSKLKQNGVSQASYNKALAQQAEAQKQVVKQQYSATNSYQSMAASMAMTGAAALAAGYAIKKGYDFVKMGAQLEFTSQKFDRMAISMGSTGDVMLGQLKVATRGTLSDFEAMATAGAPDATALSLGISEALINTFLGILGSALAIVLFNFFSTRIDSLTHAIDEAGFSVSQAVAAKK